VAGHNWSPFLRGAGGRGLSPAIGALGATAWPGPVVILSGMVLGKFVKQTGLGAFVAQVVLVPVLARTHGKRGALAALCVVVPMWLKRIAGNAAPDQPSLRVYAHRLLFDTDVPQVSTAT
jgi:glycerol-3-phosphate acyltransferase PlsY